MSVAEAPLNVSRAVTVTPSIGVAGSRSFGPAHTIGWASMNYGIAEKRGLLESRYPKRHQSPHK